MNQRVQVLAVVLAASSQAVIASSLPVGPSRPSGGFSATAGLPKFKALGVGNAADSDWGMACLTALTNLEVLAVKGGSALMDHGLTPLPSVPKLRALEIYHSRITEQGLAYLSTCRKLVGPDPLEAQARSQPAGPARATLIQ